MSFKRETEVNMSQLEAFLQNAVERVKTEENPDLLNDIKKVFKKNVPFSLRMYVSSNSIALPFQYFLNDSS